MLPCGQQRVLEMEKNMYDQEYFYENLTSSTVKSNDARPVLCRAEKNTKKEFVKSYRCWQCKCIYKFVHIKKCDGCSKLFCHNCINSEGKWLHSASNCQCCHGIGHLHTRFFLCSYSCIDFFLQSRTRKRKL